MTLCGDSFLWGGECIRVLCLPRSALPIDLGPDATAPKNLEPTTNGNIIYLPYNSSTYQESHTQARNLIFMNCHQKVAGSVTHLLYFSWPEHCCPLPITEILDTLLFCMHTRAAAVKFWRLCSAVASLEDWKSINWISKNHNLIFLSRIRATYPVGIWELGYNRAFSAPDHGSSLSQPIAGI